MIQSSDKPAAGGICELSVEGMSCGACAENVRKALAAVPGVTWAEVDLTAGHARVRLDHASLPGQKLAVASAAAGYPAKVVASVDDDRPLPGGGWHGAGGRWGASGRALPLVFRAARAGAAPPTVVVRLP